jgi:CRISPR/Cas system-associated exonuclease Cas4 (RecB family)
MVKISPSSLNLFIECPRCFWLRYTKNINRPDTPMSTLPSGVDYTLKNYYDHCREQGLALPPELDGLLPGSLARDQGLVSRMRKPVFGFNISEDARFQGALDEAIELEDGSLVPLDNKTKGFPPEEVHWTHQMQMGGYTLILRENGFKTINKAFLVYWFLNHKNMDFERPLRFHTAVEEVETKPDEVKQKILEAILVIKNQEMPAPGEACGFCQYRGINL